MIHHFISENDGNRNQHKDEDKTNASIGNIIATFSVYINQGIQNRVSDNPKESNVWGYPASSKSNPAFKRMCMMLNYHIPCST